MTPALAAVAAAALLAPQDPIRDLAAELEVLRARHEVPALGALVLEHGAVTAAGVTGVRQLGAAATVALDDPWHVASCGKAMTATVIARFVQRGHLDWHTTLAQAFPDLAAGMHEGYRTATVRQLLQHCAGLPANTTATGGFDRVVERDQSPRAQRRRIAAVALAEPPATMPGTAAVYSNTGYLIAGALLEDLADAPFEQILHRELFDPLRMRCAGVGAPRGDAHGDGVPWGHAAALGRTAALAPDLSMAQLPPFYAPSGDVHLSLADWAGFVALHVEPPPAEHAFLDAATLAALHAPGPDGHACGFTVIQADWSDGPVLAQHGATGRWHAFVQASPQHRVAFLAVCNRGGLPGTAACTEAVAALAVAWREARPDRDR
ncbi:MAG: serine hydrolase domain-containing protein [Planctomycetota bacterium]